MTENEEIDVAESSFMTSKFGKVFLTLVAVFLTFAGPTYIVYGLNVVVKVDLAASLVTGFVLFVVGMFMMRYLVKLKIIS
jgi:hypothetical protein